jgi:hypothetical protein
MRYTILKQQLILGGIHMELSNNRRFAAVKVADAINAIEGAPVSEYAKVLSICWAKGEITSQQMKSALLASHKKLAAQVQSRV